MPRGRGPRKAPRSGDAGLPTPKTAEEFHDAAVDNMEDAAEWRRLAELTEIEWIYKVCMAKADRCEQVANSWKRKFRTAKT